MQVLSFMVGTESYAVEILRVQEIKCYSCITPIPNAPAHVRGVMNLRGAVVPVIDLRVRFGAPDASCSPLTVIIVMSIKNKTVGFMVDAVSDVVDLEPDAITAPPDVIASSAPSFIASIARVEGRLFGLIDADVVASV